MHIVHQVASLSAKRFCQKCFGGLQKLPNLSLLLMLDSAIPGIIQDSCQLFANCNKTRYIIYTGNVTSTDFPKALSNCQFQLSNVSLLFTSTFSDDI